MKMRWLMLTAMVAVFVLGLALAQIARAQSATATLTANANLRAGPGTSFAKVGSASAGSTVTLAGCTTAGDWCKLADGTWVFAELLESVSAELPQVEDVTGATPASRVYCPRRCSRNSRCKCASAIASDSKCIFGQPAALNLL